MSDKAKTCLAKGCDESRDNQSFLCEDHWKDLPEEMRSKIAVLVAQADKGYRQAIAGIVFDHYWR